jgi:hypothetical protein
MVIFLLLLLKPQKSVIMKVSVSPLLDLYMQYSVASIMCLDSTSHD